jgi:hypothetical protein
LLPLAENAYGLSDRIAALVIVHVEFTCACWIGSASLTSCLHLQLALRACEALLVFEDLLLELAHLRGACN